jgi:hypothetical protein
MHGVDDNAVAIENNQHVAFGVVRDRRKLGAHRVATAR